MKRRVAMQMTKQMLVATYKYADRFELLMNRRGTPKAQDWKMQIMAMQMCVLSFNSVLMSLPMYAWWQASTSAIPLTTMSAERYSIPFPLAQEPSDEMT